MAGQPFVGCLPCSTQPRPCEAVVLTRLALHRGWDRAWGQGMVTRSNAVPTSHVLCWVKPHLK